MGHHPRLRRFPPIVGCLPRRFCCPSRLFAPYEVVVRLTNFGKHTGDFAGLAPTGNDVRWRVMAINRFEGGKIAETWVDADFLTLFQQLGSVPPELLNQ